MKLSIIIVSWNVQKLLCNLIKSIVDSTSLVDFEIIVVDNNSADNTFEKLKQNFRELIAAKKLVIVANHDNKGFAKANNQGLAIAQGEYVCFMNPDMKLIEDSFTKLINYYEQNKCSGLLGCHLVYQDLTTQNSVKGFPSLCDQLLILLKLHHLLSSFPCLHKYFQKDFNYLQDQQADQLMGAFVFASKQVFRSIGTYYFQDNSKCWDEDYPLWWEDVELCWDAKAMSLNNYYTNVTKVIHLESKSFEQIKGLKKQKRFVIGMKTFFRKHKPLWQCWLISWFSYPSLCLAWLTGIFNVRQRPQSRI